MKLIIVGYRGRTHIGEGLERAALELGIDVKLVESRLAEKAPKWLAKLNWRLRGKRPTRLGRFSNDLSQLCQEWKPDVFITTGIAPVNRSALCSIHGSGVRTLNFSTDDPWNRNHYSPWFLQALPQYDLVVSTRYSNLSDLAALGCRLVTYLPFGYDPQLHFPEPVDSIRHTGEADADIVFLGAGDPDRVPFIAALIRDGFRVALYGSFWDRFPDTRPFTRGQANVDTARAATTCAKVALCLVRRANRDGHVMRSFEIPAMGGCMLAEYTAEHREIFGEEGKAVIYFRNVAGMLDKTRWLLAHAAERRRLAESAHRLITSGGHTYADRLRTMLDTVIPQP